MATFEVEYHSATDRMIVVEADNKDSARQIADEFIAVNPDLDDDGETVEGVVSYGTYTENIHVDIKAVVLG
jgi:hypothetical protein